jgi:LmbE family N-acetylglucosaminyl deacetylase
MTNVMVVAAHPDDEVLGCGGTISRHVRQGDRVDVLILAEGITSRRSRTGAAARRRALALLKESARRANRLLGVRSLTFSDLPDNRMDSVDRLEIARKVEAMFERYRPAVVYTHHGGDLNVDHRRAQEAVVVAARPMPGRSVTTVLSFEVPSSTEWQAGRPGALFAPDWFVDISADLPKKIKALRAYGSEMRAWPHARSLEAVTHLARWRGATVGTEAAEAFVLARHVVKP